MQKLGHKLTNVTVGILLLATTLVACGGTAPEEPTGSGDSGEPAKVALLFPGSENKRYEKFDVPLFEAKITTLGNFDVVYADTGQDTAAQVKQAESALAAGAAVMVLGPVTPEAAERIVDSATEQEVPVISYDTLIAESTGLAYRVSFDQEQTGVLQANSLVQELRKQTVPNPGILMVNGPRTDPEALLFNKGAHSVIDKSSVKILAEFDTPGWDPAQAQTWVAEKITQFPGRINGIYAATDDLAGGASAALSEADSKPWPVITGQNADLESIRRIITGKQFMSIYKPVRVEAELAAGVAAKLAQGQDPPPATNVAGIPTRLLIPKVITKSSIMDTVVRDGAFTVGEICSGKYAKACAAANIK